MLKHQFAIASNKIEEEKITIWINSDYIINKINIDDDFIQKFSKELDNLQTVWVTSSKSRKINNNLNYYGITIIPNEEIEKFLKENLELELNKKTQIFKNKQGVNFCGYKINEYRIKIRDKGKKRLKNKIINLKLKIKKRRNY